MNFKQMLMAFVAVFVFALPVFAQEKTVTGKVIDSQDGKPLIGATVKAKPTTNSATSIITQTDAKGLFKIVVPAATTTLIISYTGFTTLEVPIVGEMLNISLVQSVDDLNEVVVVGYGTAKKKDLTGAVATVSSKDFQKGAISTPEQMIAGKVAGVSIISNGGQPGSGSTIRIRGGSSLSASNDPLIVIDGVPVENSSISGAGNALSFINQNDIESFTVLKDASAAAIYGTRASNGVILITTKKGKSGKLKVQFSSVNSISVIKKTMDVLNGDQIRSIVNANGTTAQKAMLGTANTDWQDEIFRTAFATDNNITLTGGIKKLPYRLTLGYMNQDGILRTDNLQRTSISLALNPVLLDNHLKVDINLKGTAQRTRFANVGAIGGAVNFDPTQPVYATVKPQRFNGYYEWLDPSSQTGLNTLAGKNPVGMLTERYDRSSPKRAIGNIQLDYKLHFLPDLHVNLNAGFDISRGEGTIFISDSAAQAYVSGGLGGANNFYKQEKSNTVFEFFLTYAKDLKSINSKFDVTAGYSYNNFLTTNYAYASYYADGRKVPNSDPVFEVDKPENTLLSYFARLNYNLADKYLLTATIRRDGSSRFGPDNRWGNFPSAAFSWRINRENFLRGVKAITDLKLRVGYGVTGQQDGIGNYDYLSYYALSNTAGSYQFGTTYYQGYRPGGFYAARKWEETTTYNAALDFGLFNNRITGSIDFYLKKTNDLLNNIPQPAGTNFSAFIVANVGSMENKGVEFTLNTQPISKKDLTLDVAFNITYNKNTITNLTVVPNDPNYIGFPSTNINGVQGFAFLNAVGGPKNTFYLYQQVYDSKTGKPIEGLFDDKNRDGIINEDDKYKGPSADPKVFLGFSTGLTYKKWNAGFVLRGSFDNYVYNNIYSNNGRLNQILGGVVLGNASSHYLETGFKGTTDQQLLSDYYIQNASFLRMDNLTLGYNFGKLNKHVSSLRANLSVQNVFVITKYTGLDPEIGNGVDNNNYPRPRIISLGLNLDF